VQNNGHAAVLVRDQVARIDCGIYCSSSQTGEPANLRDPVSEFDRVLQGKRLSFGADNRQIKIVRARWQCTRGNNDGGNQSGQLPPMVSLAAVLDGRNRTVAAQFGAMDRQTLRDWVHRFNEKGPVGLVNGKAPGSVSKLSAEQKQS
jgi:hypothetical protein